MSPICPECIQGKHSNCDGIANINDDALVVMCTCLNGDHPNRIVSLKGPIVPPQPVPENDPGIWTEAFPELVEDGYAVRKHRLRPDSEVIHDLLDIEILNPQGEWVPIIPRPLHVFMGITQCLCGKRRLGEKRYQEHYAYAHILGMED